MVFTKQLREGIRRGRITCSVRVWTRPHVKVGGRYVMDEGHIVVDSFDELFVSDRDGKPLVVVYGSRLKDSDVLIYEQTGVNGKRLVGHRIGMVEEVDEAEYKKLTAPKN